MYEEHSKSKSFLFIPIETMTVIKNTITIQSKFSDTKYHWQCIFMSNEKEVACYSCKWVDGK